MSAELREWITRLSDPNWYPFKGMSVDESPLEEDAVVIDPTNDFAEVSDEYEEDDEDDEDEEEGGGGEEDLFVYRGKKDARGYFHGGGTVTFGNGDVLMCDFEHGVRFGEGVVVSPRNGISRLVGTYVGGRLQGKGKVVSTNTSVTECFFKDGVIHGPVRRTEMKKFREFRQQLAFIGRFKSGRPSGPCWTYRDGGGYLFSVEKGGSNYPPLSGDDVAYLYPDLSNAWLGSFKDGRMAGARRTRVIRAARNKEDGLILVPVFDAPSGEAVAYSKSSRTSMGENLLVPDPYEESHVVCAESPFCGGQGLFALRDLPAGTVVSFYNGVRIPFVLGGPKEDWDSSAYKIFVNADFVSGERMDIPAEYTDLARYRASMGHKMNHSFVPNCLEWFFDHPRFGVVPCQRTTRAVREGEELLMDYEYDPYNCPEWFRCALIEFVSSSSSSGKGEELEGLSERYLRFVENECTRQS